MKSELRVGLNLSTAAGGINAPEVIMSLDFEGKKITFDKYVINLSNLESFGGDLNKFIAYTFSSLGAELIEDDKYGLYFTLDPAENPQYSPIIGEIVENSQYLKLRLNKKYDLQVDKGLDPEPAVPDTPVNIPVKSIVIDTVSHSYFRGSNITIDFSLTPSNTSDTKVSWTTHSKGSGTITAKNGKGELVLSNVTVDDTVTFTIANGQTAQFQIKLTDSIENISFLKSSYQLEQNKSQTIAIDNYDKIKTQISNLTYTSSNPAIASVDNNGNVKGLKNGVATITANATSNGKKLSASYELDVLGHIDYTDENSLQGTYDIVFFGTNSNGKGTTAAILNNNCDIYKQLWSDNTCKSGTGSYQIPTEDFVGRALIKATNGVLKVHTKVAFKAGGIAATAAPNDQYQYTVYSDASLNTWIDTNYANGSMTGRNLSSDIGSLKNPKYYFEQNKSYNTKSQLDIVMFSHFTGKKAFITTVDPDTRLILRKISSKVIPMDANSLSEEPFNKISLTLGDVKYTAPSLD